MALLVIISSPSGGGKDAVIRELIKLIPKSTRMTTTTSRSPRPGEKNGVDLFFVSKDEFENKLKRNAFAEHNLYSGNFYGTERERLENLLSNFAVVFTNIDINGKHNLDKAGFKNISFFLLPENLEVLKNRIIKRGGVLEEELEKRLERAKKEIADAKNYDFQIVNKEGCLKETTVEIAEIIKKELINRQAVDKKE